MTHTQWYIEKTHCDIDELKLKVKHMVSDLFLTQHLMNGINCLHILNKVQLLIFLKAD